MQRVIGTFTDEPDVLAFINSNSAKALAHLGTSCPDHFIGRKFARCLWIGTQRRRWLNWKRRWMPRW